MNAQILKFEPKNKTNEPIDTTISECDKCGHHAFFIQHVELKCTKCGDVKFIF